MPEASRDSGGSRRDRIIAAIPITMVEWGAVGGGRGIASTRNPFSSNGSKRRTKRRSSCRRCTGSYSGSRSSMRRSKSRRILLRLLWASTFTTELNKEKTF